MHHGAAFPIHPHFMPVLRATRLSCICLQSMALLESANSIANVSTSAVSTKRSVSLLQARPLQHCCCCCSRRHPHYFLVNFPEASSTSTLHATSLSLMHRVQVEQTVHLGTCVSALELHCAAQVEAGSENQEADARRDG